MKSSTCRKLLSLAFAFADDLGWYHRKQSQRIEQSKHEEQNSNHCNLGEGGKKEVREGVNNKLNVLTSQCSLLCQIMGFGAAC